jgi:hypothetical protein
MTFKSNRNCLLLFYSEGTNHPTSGMARNGTDKLVAACSRGFKREAIALATGNWTGADAI